MDTDTSQPAAPKRRRRWYQFSLRTLFVVVTLFSIPCAYVGWQAKIVAERKAWLRAYQQPGGWDHWPPKILALPTIDSGGRRPTLSGVRRWLGDEAEVVIFVHEKESTEDLKAATALFPEAVVYEYPDF
jgi:hypothetical protein